MSDTYDVIIVGGGLLGCATAFSLARRGLKRVLVIERTTLGAQTTSRAASLVTRSRGHAQDRVLIAQTREMIKLLNAEYGEDVGFNRVGSLHVAETPDSANTLETAMSDLFEEGIAVDWLTTETACQKAGWLKLDKAEAIAFVPDDGYVDPYLLCAAYARAAKSKGASFLQGEEVIEVSKDHVRTTTQTLRASQVIVTTGPWMNMLLSHIPMAPVRSQYWITADHFDVLDYGPVVVLPDAKAYARPEVGGLLFGIRDDEAVYAAPKNLPIELSGFSFNEDYDGWESLAQSADAFMERCPMLADININHYISGPSSYTPDGQFIIGEYDGLIVAGGACGAGLSISGGVGETIADALCDNKKFPARYDPNRFGKVDGHAPEFLKKCAMARAQKRAG